jgi:cytochrome c5
MEDHQHTSPIKSPKQLVIVVLLAFLVPITLILLLSQLITGAPRGAQDDDSAVLKRIQPVGTVMLADAGAPKGTLTGEQVFGQVCKTCHEAGIAGAHKLGDKAAWAKVIAQGEKLTFEHAQNGIRAMPARGGNPDLTDAEVQRAVVYMVNQAGASWKAPAVAALSATPAPAAAEQLAAAPAASPAPSAPATVAAAPVAMAAAAPAAKPDGKKTYDSVCMVCHAAGVAGAPKFGDKAQWAPRIATGVDALYAAAIKGKNAMPAKGGNAALPDADVKAAVDYMVAAAK